MIDDIAREIRSLPSFAERPTCRTGALRPEWIERTRGKGIVGFAELFRLQNLSLEWFREYRGEHDPTQIVGPVEWKAGPIADMATAR